MFSKIWSLLNKLPSFVWVFLFPLGIILFVVFIATLFMLLGSVEGFASIIVILIGTLYVIFWKPIPIPQDKMSGLITGGIIFFWALMATVLDQTGNVIYNKPIEIFFCPAETSLTRRTIVSHPLPGRTDINQNFNCFDKDDKIVKSVNPFQVLLVRFVEYVFLIYFFNFCIWIKGKYFKRDEV